MEVSSASTMAGKLAGVITGGFAPLPCTNSKMRPTMEAPLAHPRYDHSHVPASFKDWTFQRAHVP